MNIHRRCNTVFFFPCNCCLQLFMLCKCSSRVDKLRLLCGTCSTFRCSQVAKSCVIGRIWQLGSYIQGQRSQTSTHQQLALHFQTNCGTHNVHRPFTNNQSECVNLHSPPCQFGLSNFAEIPATQQHKNGHNKLLPFVKPLISCALRTASCAQHVHRQCGMLVICGLFPSSSTSSVINCGFPGAPVNGGLSGRDYSVGSEITYSCVRGYRLQGNRTRQCQASGVWSGQIPTCQTISESQLDLAFS